MFALLRRLHAGKITESQISHNAPNYLFLYKKAALLLSGLEDVLATPFVSGAEHTHNFPTKFRHPTVSHTNVV